MFYLQNISIYMNFGGYGRGEIHIKLYIFLFIIQKKWNKYKSMTYTKIKFYIILIKKNFLGWIINFLWKRGSRGPRQCPLQYRPECTTLCGWLIHDFSSVIKRFLQYFSIEDTHFMNESFIKISRTFVKFKVDPALEL